MKQTLVTAAVALAASFAFAKLPPPDDAAKAKNAETAAKAAWQAKAEGYQLCKAQDRIAALYRKNAGKQAMPAAAARPASGAAAAASAPVAQASGAQPAAPAASSSAAGSGGAGTPVASAPPPPCIDPGPFAYNPPEQKPLETSGAHSPSGTAASPPSVKEHSGAIQAPKKP